MLKLYRFLKPYTTQILALLVLIFLQTTSDLYLPTLMSEIIDKGVMSGDTGKIVRIGGLMLLVAAGGVLCAILSSLLASKVSVGLGRMIRSKVFSLVESYSLYEFDKFGTSTLITRTTNDVTQVQMVTLMILRMMVSAPMMAIGGVILALRQDPPLTLVLAVALPLMAIFILFIARKIMPLFGQVQKKIDRINLILREKLTGIRVIRAFDTVEHEQRRFDQANVDLTGTFIRVNRIMAFLMPMIMLIMSLTSISILWFGGIRISDGAMELGSLAAFIQYAFQIMFSMVMLSMMFIMVPRAQAAAVRINEVLETRPGIADPDKSREDYQGRGHLEFKDVTFSYHGAEQPVLKNISFSAKPGEITAIIGSTGSGKTTLVNLIPRFYDIDSGSITLDSVDIREMSQEALRSKVGYAPQKAVLFSGTIAENIRIGKPDATDDEIRQAAEVAQAMEFISEMDEGFDHMIAQGGTNISGGQKQRLSIARTLIRKPEIYIFDDTFSALDYKTDAKLRSALRKEIAEATVILVAQRVGTVMDAHRIIVLDEGRIAGIGRHQELLESCSVYREIVASQLSEEEIA